MTTLYVKTHNDTGLKYFGKTNKYDIEKYTGSGKYWLRHIKKHGYNVTTEIYLQFENDFDENIKVEGLKFSEENNIVESKSWANLVPENGSGNTLSGELNPNYNNKWSNEQKEAASKKSQGSIVVRNIESGKVFKTTIEEYENDENLEAESKGRKILDTSNMGYKIGRDNINWGGKCQTEEVKEKMRGPRGKQITGICPHCNKEGGLSNMKRYHFDNCKFNISLKNL